ncbi:MAG: multidrug MFS transporter [Paracoccus denitrificans]|nr:MAG: multidrug MFS transporter [Paracoccus denitrificans]PZO84725.1 MAG: multidrug MFS transporter [Paracoccus denitrificans]
MSQTDATGARRLKQPELIAMLAAVFATVAFSIDAMLPALPQIAAELTPTDVNRAQLILTVFTAGMGIGTLFTGPISDAIGRKPTILFGFGIYLLAAIGAAFAQSLEMLLFARFVQGLGAAAPRVVGTALIRDMYQGRDMARITSFVMMVFMIVPALAPSIGQGFIYFLGWRGVFLAFVLFGLISVTWFSVRQPETLPIQRRRPLNPRLLWSGIKEVLSDREIVLYTLTLALGFGQMFGLLSSAQQLFGEAYGKGDNFPRWFALLAILSACGMFLNSRLVMTVGMRRIARGAYVMQICMSAIFLTLLLTGVLPAALSFPVFFIWAVSVFMMAGLTFGNLNALAMQRKGHIAGMTASVVSAFSTVAAVCIAAPVGLAYNGTAVPVAISTLVCSTVACIILSFLMNPHEDQAGGH